MQNRTAVRIGIRLYHIKKPSFGTCSAQCAGGVKRRSRGIDQYARNNGAACEGEDGVINWALSQMLLLVLWEIIFIIVVGPEMELLISHVGSGPGRVTATLVVAFSSFRPQSIQTPSPKARSSRSRAVTSRFAVTRKIASGENGPVGGHAARNAEAGLRRGILLSGGGIKTR